jgi:hypothetical protein
MREAARMATSFFMMSLLKGDGVSENY